MSKNKNTASVPSLGYGEGFVISGSYAMDNLQGRLLTLVESYGLPERQEKAAKDLLRNELWRWWGEMTTYITPEEHTNLRKVVNERSERSANGGPFPSVLVSS